MSDNVDFYRKIIFRPPHPRRLAVYLAVLGTVFGVVSVFLLSPSSSLRVNLAGAVLAAMFFYIVPAFLSGEITSRFGDINRKWTYLMSLFDQVILFLFSLTIPFTDSASEAWQVMWLGLATVYLLNLVMVLMSRGRRSLHWNVSYALIFPGMVLIAFHLSIGRLVGIPRILYLQNSVLVLASAFLLLLTFGLYDFLIRANVDLSTFDFTSTLLLGEERTLEGGMRTDIHHQSLEIDNGDTLTFNIPWLHPGPVDGFGGGKLTSKLIDDSTFMLHTPSYHTLDLADPDDIDLFREPPEPEKSGKASKLLKLEKGGFTLWGRKYRGGKVVYVQNRDIDDYEPSIAHDLKEEYPELCLVDLHNQALRKEKQGWLQHMDREARVLERAVGEMVDRLEGSEMEGYTAGFAGDGEYRCLVEKVGDQETVLLGVNASDAPELLHEVEEELDFDEVLVFTTDSHENLVEMASPGYGKEELLEAVADAEENLADAEAGIGERVVEEVRVLGKDYEGLITTLNVMARLIPITLLLYYLGIVFLIL